MAAKDLYLTQRNASNTGFEENLVTNISSGKFFRVDASGNVVSHDLTKVDVGLNNVLNAEQLTTSQLSTSTTLGTSDTLVPSQNAVKTYIDNVLDGRAWGEAVEVMMDTNYPVALLDDDHVVDGYTPSIGDYVILAGQTDLKENGVYLIGDTGAATTRLAAADMANRAFLIKRGSYGDTAWVCSNDTITYGTTEINFVQIGSSSQPDATTTIKGISRYATEAETYGKSAVPAAVTPDALADYPIVDSGLGTVTDNSVVISDGTTGRKVGYSTVTIDDNGSINIPSGQSYKVNGAVYLGNVTNNAQVRKAASSVSGNIPLWSGTNGDLLDGTGLSVQDAADTLTDVDTAVPTSAAIIDYVGGLIEDINYLDLVGVPSTATSTGASGQVAFDNDYVYFCVAANTWKRHPLAVF